MAKKKTFVVDYNLIERTVWSFSEPLAASCGAELIDVEYVKEGSSWYLRLYIDREPPVDHDLCEAVSNLVSDKLDEVDCIPHEYYLEISSPGLERPLHREEDFKRFAGAEVVVKLYAAKDGKKEFEGVLDGKDEENIYILLGEERVACAEEAVAKCHLKADI